MDLGELKNLYEKALFIRAFEDRVAASADAGHVPGLVHLNSGAELAELAVISLLDMLKDQVTGSHRSHGLALACGVDPLALAREILGRKGGLSDGLGGTQHLMAPENGFLTSNGIVGGQVPLAAGAALSAKTLGTGGIAATFMGDGAVNQGAVQETLNLAVALNLPLLFVVINNGFGQSTAASYATAGSLIGRARAFGLAADQVDGQDPAAMMKAADRMVGWVRKTGSPAFIEAKVIRLSGHYHGDAEPYRQRGERSDPLPRVHDMLIKMGAKADELESFAITARLKAEGVIAKAEKSKDISGQALAAWQAAGGV
ncbi:thiamine pyrophosphate-dependent dehydrogenase E1 component subunit alpha [Kordiimonas aestuarii]|uniref:thiamine pyrophosphate-dependent dehydrogenase E1 component subunit alpha n=1 Tax=Kordiimonas aestuarii TaxID=1005925 RepID=UPI0021D3A65F|nr:thiamine pyrophosphate-dependent dehydrogenase E1 component subunit alpha [Kordiimonas aestuarii]